MDIDTRIKACKEIFELILKDYDLDFDLKCKINNFIVKYKNSNNESLWPFISTAFLMSQEFITTDGSYKFLQDRVDQIEDYFLDDEGKENILFLDACSNDLEYFRGFLYDVMPEDMEPCNLLTNGKVDADKCDYFLKNAQIHIEGIKDFFVNNNYILNGEVINDFKYNFKKIIDQLYNTYYGYNSEIVDKNDIIDIIKLIICVRNSLAHSNYEVIDENRIRVFSLNKEYNFIINKKLILFIINEVSEYHYLLSKLFVPIVIPQEFIDTKKMTHEVIMNLLKYFKINGSNATKLCREFENRYKEELRKYDFTKNYSLFAEFISNKFKSPIYFGKIINEHLYSDKGTNYKKELLDICANYTYMNCDVDMYEDEPDDELAYEKMRYSYFSEKNMEDRLKYYLLTLINTIYHSSYNTLDSIEDDEEIFSIDLSFIKIDNKYKRKIIDDIETKYFQNILYQIDETKKNINSIINRIKTNKEHKNKAKTTESKDKLSKIILKEKAEQEKLENQLKELNKSYNEKKLLFSVQKDKYLNYQVLKYVRHALSHGDIYFEKPFDFKNIGNNTIVFESYETCPTKDNEKTFIGTCKVSDLLNSIMDEKNIVELCEIDKKNTKVKKYIK